MQHITNDLLKLAPALAYAEDLPQAIRSAEENTAILALDGVCRNNFFDRD